MVIVRLAPSDYIISNLNRVTVTNSSYTYNNTDDTSNYAQFRGRNSSNYTYYAFLHEFNFSDVPSNIIITNFRVLIKCYRNSYQRTDVDKNNNPIVNYTYILSSVTAAHNLIVTIGDAAVQIYLKENGSWVPYSKVYKKINGSLVEQSDLSSVFSTSANYVKQS